MRMSFGCVFMAAVSARCGFLSSPQSINLSAIPGCGRSTIGAAYIGSVSTHGPDNRDEHLELPVDELLRRARPLPPHDEMVIEDLSENEGAAFRAAIES